MLRILQRFLLFFLFANYSSTLIAEATKLVPLQNLEKSLSVDESHFYEIRLSAGQYLELIVEQRGSDALVVVTGPDKKKILEMDSILGPDGPERVLLLANTAGTYTIEVRGSFMETPSGSYLLQVGVPRQATASDQKRAAANEKFALAGVLYLEGSAESLKKAETNYSEALEVWKELQDPVGQALVLHALALISDFTGNREKGLHLYQQNLPVWSAYGNQRLVSLTLQNIGFDFLRLGENEKALQYFNEALELAQSTKDPHNEAHAYHNLGMYYLDAGEYQKAIECHQQALKLRRDNKIRSEEADSLYELGSTYIKIGDFQSALRYYLEVLPLDRESGNRRDQAATLDSIGLVYYSSGDLSRAIEHYQQSLELRRQTNDREGEPATHLHIGRIYSDQGHSSQAMKEFLESLKIATETKFISQQVAALNELTELGVRTEKLSEADQWSRQALLLAKKTQNPEDLWESQLARARVLRAQHQNPKAMELLKEAAEIINSLHARVLTDSTKIGFFDKHQDVFHELAALQLQEKQVSASLETAEAARARALIDLLAARQFHAKPAKAQRIAEIRNLEARFRAQAKVSAAGGASGAKRTASSVEKAYEDQMLALQKDEGELASLMFADPPSIGKILETVKRVNATVVEYLVTKERLLLWIIQPSGEIKSRSVAIERRQLQSMIGDLHSRLNNVDLEALKNPDALNGQLRNLYHQFLEPAAPYLPQDPDAPVYIIPHDVLFLVPFGALLNEKGEYLIERHTIAFAPSISVLEYTAPKKKLVAPFDKPYLLAFADPLLPKGVDLEQLPGAREEVREISRYFAPEHTSLLSGELATEANFKRLSPAQTILHVAVHGLIYDDRPWESALLLSEGGGEDGFLRVSEIFGLDLHADLVVLSGCSTGLGKLSGDGMVGLSRAFVYAGTPSLVVSQWDVSDKATALLMETFYRAMHNGSNKAAALRAAQLENLRELKHPALWAAFHLIGEAQ